MNVKIKKKGIIFSRYEIENEKGIFKRNIYYFKDDRLKYLENCLQNKNFIKGANPFDHTEKDDSNISDSIMLECYYDKSQPDFLYYKMLKWVPYEYVEVSDLTKVKK